MMPLEILGGPCPPERQGTSNSLVRGGAGARAQLGPGWGTPGRGRSQLIRRRNNGVCLGLFLLDSGAVTPPLPPFHLGPESWGRHTNPSPMTPTVDFSEIHLSTAQRQRGSGERAEGECRSGSPGSLQQGLPLPQSSWLFLDHPIQAPSSHSWAWDAWAETELLHLHTPDKVRACPTPQRVLACQAWE